MVTHPGVIAIGDADKPCDEVRPVPLDLPVEMCTFDGRHREIAQDEIESEPQLNKHKGCSAVGDHLHLVAVSRQDISDERSDLRLASTTRMRAGMGSLLERDAVPSADGRSATGTMRGTEKATAGAGSAHLVKPPEG